MVLHSGLLRQKIDALHHAGLRNITIGFYGTGDAYDHYVGRSDRFAKLVEALRYVRERYGENSVAQIGTPRTKLRVPSIGSMIQR